MPTHSHRQTHSVECTVYTIVVYKIYCNMDTIYYRIAVIGVINLILYESCNRSQHNNMKLTYEISFMLL